MSYESYYVYLSTIEVWMNSMWKRVQGILSNFMIEHRFASLLASVDCRSLIPFWCMRHPARRQSTHSVSIGPRAQNADFQSCSTVCWYLIENRWLQHKVASTLFAASCVHPLWPQVDLFAECWSVWVEVRSCWIHMTRDVSPNSGGMGLVCQYRIWRLDFYNWRDWLGQDVPAARVGKWKLITNLRWEQNSSNDAFSSPR